MLPIYRVYICIAVFILAKLRVYNNFIQYCKYMKKVFSG